MTESKKGHNFAIQGPTGKKKIRVRLFFVLMLYIKFQVPSSSGSLVLQPTKGVKDRRTDGQTERPKPICPINFFEHHVNIDCIFTLFTYLFLFFPN